MPFFKGKEILDVVGWWMGGVAGGRPGRFSPASFCSPPPVVRPAVVVREGGARRADFGVISDVLALTCRGAVVMSDQTQRPKPNASGDRNI